MTIIDRVSVAVFLSLSSGSYGLQFEPALQAAPPCLKDMKFEGPDKAAPSSDISASACRDRCASAPWGCKSWSFFAASTHGGSCFLHGQDAKPSAHKGAVSGGAHCMLPNEEVGGADCHESTKYVEGILAGEPTTNEKDVRSCKARCVQNTACKFFTFSYRKGECILHNELASLRKAPGAYAGPRTCKIPADVQGKVEVQAVANSDAAAKSQPATQQPQAAAKPEEPAAKPEEPEKPDEQTMLKRTSAAEQVQHDLKTAADAESVKATADMSMAEKVEQSESEKVIGSMIMWGAEKLKERLPSILKPFLAQPDKLPAFLAQLKNGRADASVGQLLDYCRTTLSDIVIESSEAHGLLWTDELKAKLAAALDNFDSELLGILKHFVEVHQMN